MSLLQSIQTGKSQGPPRLLIYGTEGIGKSTFGDSAPRPIFVPTEDGLDNIACDSFPMCRSFNEVMSCLQSLLDEPHEYRTVVVDSIDWLERLILDHACQKYGVENIEKVEGGYGKGYTIVLTYWRQFIDLLRSLRMDKGMIVILLAHAQIKQHIDPETTAFDTFFAETAQKCTRPRRRMVRRDSHGDSAVRCSERRKRRWLSNFAMRTFRDMQREKPLRPARNPSSRLEFAHAGDVSSVIDF